MLLVAPAGERRVAEVVLPEEDRDELVLVRLAGVAGGAQERLEARQLELPVPALGVADLLPADSLFQSPETKTFLKVT